MEVFPGDPFSLEQIEEWINELIKNKLLYIFEDNGESFWYVSGWKHQKIDKPSYKYPIPPLFDECSTNGSGVVDEPSPPEGKGKEGKKKSTKRKFVAPSLEEVKKYFSDNGYLESVGEKAWKSYNVANWIDSRGNEIKNWKQKMVNVWFDEKNKAPVKLTDEQIKQIQQAMRKEIEWTPELKQLKEIYLEKYG